METITLLSPIRPIRLGIAIKPFIADENVQIVSKLLTVPIKAIVDNRKKKVHTTDGLKNSRILIVMKKRKIHGSFGSKWWWRC